MFNTYLCYLSSLNGNSRKRNENSWWKDRPMLLHTPTVDSYSANGWGQVLYMLLASYAQNFKYFAASTSFLCDTIVYRTK